MKKILVLVLALVMALSAVSALADITIVQNKVEIDAALQEYAAAYSAETGKNVKVAVPALLGKNDVVLKAGSNYAFASKKMVRLSDATTKAQFFGDGEALYLPLEFAENTLKLNLEGEKRYNHYGVLYGDVKEALEKSGKTLTETEGLLVISDKTFTEDECLELYRALY